jgi:hypothetical protein
LGGLPRKEGEENRAGRARVDQSISVAGGRFQVDGLVAPELGGDGWKNTLPKWLIYVHACKIRAISAGIVVFFNVD